MAGRIQSETILPIQYNNLIKAGPDGSQTPWLSTTSRAWHKSIIIVMWEYIIGALCLVAAATILWIMQPYFVWKKSQAKKTESGKIIVIDTAGKTLGLHDHLQSKATRKIELSLVVPSYNEEERLPIMLAETIAYLKKNKIEYEIIVVNDGSKDKTSQVAIQKGKEEQANLYVVEYPKNRGKGGAVRAGMACAIGKQILMVDADGATTFSELGKLQAKMKEIIERNGHPLAMVAGSRSHLDEDVTVNRKLHRRLVSSVFGLIKTVVCGVKTKDTQCGFKLFTRESAKMLFQVLHIERWAFDIELFVLCGLFRVETAEVGVEWHDVDGSKLNVIEASINMFRDTLMIRLMYTLRLWKQSDKVIVE